LKKKNTMKYSSLILWILLGFMLLPLAGKAQEEKKEEGYVFTDIKRWPATPVKDQHRSGTCWSFSGISLLESELLRMGKGEYDLSDMFIVRASYAAKARKYVRMNGHLNMAAGGAFHDVFNVMRTEGMLPEEVYNGLVIGEDNHVHGEMDEVFKKYVDAIIANKNRKLSPVWADGFDALLDTYLGEVPKSFDYKGKTYTPQSFAASLGLNPDDYINLTSFTHHPFYKPFIIEVPDNWAWGTAYNIPLDELIQVMDFALDKGYTIAWGSDVSEKGFSHRKGVAIVPEKDFKEMSGAEIERWEKMPKKDQEKELYSFDKPGRERVITQAIRQLAFDNYETTDDHGMHIIGTAKDQNGTLYYIVKNSWADNSNDFGGYFYASVPFVRYKTLNIVLHKNGIPDAIRKKLGIQ